jgi:hypothetical protein
VSTADQSDALANGGDADVEQCQVGAANAARVSPQVCAVLTQTGPTDGSPEMVYCPAPSDGVVRIPPGGQLRTCANVNGLTQTRAPSTGRPEKRSVITPESVNVGPTGVLGTVGTVGDVGRDRGSSPHALITSNRHSPAARHMMPGQAAFNKAVAASGVGRKRVVPHLRWTTHLFLRTDCNSLTPKQKATSPGN